jgi:hypothetical protein
MSSALPYLPGRFLQRPEPLERFLPPVPDGVISTWLSRYAPPGSWVVDPFGASPRLAVEAARAGYRVLVAASNPISRFLLEMAANPPPQAELSASLAELAAAHRGDERIEPHILSLYKTECASCGQPVTASAFLWERGANTPYARVYHCPHCNDEGERPATHADEERAAQFTTGGIHWARALERVAPQNDPDRIHVEEAISAYPPRAVYALFTLINRLDGLPISAMRRRYLQALLVFAYDQSNKLWPHPHIRRRPKALDNIPVRFRENNVWFALERGVEYFGIEQSPLSLQSVPLTIWPKQPLETTGICLYEGRFKDLVDELKKFEIRAVYAAIPRTNPAFWKLSALWAGWLWGHEAIGSYKSVLRRHRYGWDWHTTALYAALHHLTPILSPDTPFLGLIGEVEVGFITAAMIAADAVGFELKNVALRLEQDQAQITWHRESELITPQEDVFLDQVAGQAATQYLEERGEPASYLSTYIAALAGINTARAFRLQHPIYQKQAESEIIDKAKEASFIDISSEDDETEVSAGEPSEEHIKLEAIPQALNKSGTVQPHHWYTQAQSAIRVALTYRGGFLRFGTSSKASSDLETEKMAESGLFWLQEVKNQNIPPLADRTEMTLVSFLLKHPGCSMADIDNILCETFPGMLSPDTELLQVCLDSYGERKGPDDEGWYLRSQDSPAERKRDLDEAYETLQKLGTRLGYRIQDQPPIPGGSKTTLMWVDAFGQPCYAFFPIASAVLGEIMLQRALPAPNSTIVLPGGRANLVAYKLRCDPRLGKLCSSTSGGWRFLKFRHLRWLYENPLLSRENLEEQLALDPLTYSTPQLRLL